VLDALTGAGDPLDVTVASFVAPESATDLQHTQASRLVSPLGSTAAGVESFFGQPDGPSTLINLTVSRASQLLGIIDSSADGLHTARLVISHVETLREMRRVLPGFRLLFVAIGNRDPPADVVAGFAASCLVFGANAPSQSFG
jgi:hypothetical protein